jgi:hypothetical protein
MIMISQLLQERAAPIRPRWRGFRLLAMACLLALCGMVPRAFAQFETAVVEGIVQDSSGARVANAKVSLHNLDLGTVLTRSTSKGGSYEFPDVQVGSYTITVESPGFDPSITDPFDVEVAANVRIDVPMTVSGAHEHVQVVASDTGLEIDTSDRGTTIEPAQILDLPLNGREYTDLALLTPGVQVSALQDGTVSQRRGSIVVNGNRSSVNNFLLDGLDNNSYQTANQGLNNQALAESVDAIKEYRVITSNFPAEYGRAGGAIVNVSTRSGSSQFHATAFEYIRNTALDAYGPFYGTGVKPRLTQNQFGGSVGGAVPRIRSFFYFADYEGFRQATHAYTTAAVPTVDQRNGLFYNETGAPIPLMNPYTGTVYKNGQIPASDFTAFATAVIAAMPMPTQPGFGANFAYTAPGTSFRDIGDIRLDKYFGNRTQAFVRVSKQSAHSYKQGEIPGPAGGNGFGHIRILTTAVDSGVTYLLTANSVIDARFGATLVSSGKLPLNYGVPSFQSQFNIPYPVDPSLGTAGLNSQNLRGFAQFGTEDSDNQYTSPNGINPKISYTLAHGRHSFSVGYEYMHLNEAVAITNPIYGEDTYTGNFSKGPKAPANTTARGEAYGLADFIYGARSAYELSNRISPTEYTRYHFGYAEDTWRVFSHLTLNYGMRYEFATPERVLNNQLANFDPTTNSLAYAKSGSIFQEALVHPNTNNFGPRVGFSYSPYSNIVFRGGYGVSFVQFNRYGGESDLVQNGPFAIDSLINQDLTVQPICPAGSMSLTCFRPTMQGYPASMISSANFSTSTAEIRYVQPKAGTGYVQSYSLGTQLELSKTTVLDIAYVGNHAIHLRVLGDYNQAALQAPGGMLTLQQRRPLQNFADIYDNISQGFLRYNSLQVKVTQQPFHGLFFLNSFTWSKAIDNASADLEAANGDTAYVNIANIRGDTGISGYNQTLNDSLAATWVIPFGKGIKNRIAHGFATGWSLATITRMTSGIPMNLSYSPTANNVTTNLGYNYRPNITGFVYNVVNPRNQWVKSDLGYSNVFNLNAISEPDGSAPYGNAPRNGFTGPAYYNLDLGLHRDIALPQHVKLQLRIEAFNALNHTNLKTPNTNFTGASFGEFTVDASDVFPSRQVQLAVRLTY